VWSRRSSIKSIAFRNERYQYGNKGVIGLIHWLYTIDSRSSLCQSFQPHFISANQQLNLPQQVIGPVTTVSVISQLRQLHLLAKLFGLSQQSCGHLDLLVFFVGILLTTLKPVGCDFAGPSLLMRANHLATYTLILALICGIHKSKGYVVWEISRLSKPDFVHVEHFWRRHLLASANW
jgi:hypothetical protein